MFKRLIAWLLSIAVLALFVVTVLHRDRYRSWIFGGAPEVEEPSESSAAAPVQLTETERCDVPVPTTMKQPEASPEPEMELLAEDPAEEEDPFSVTPSE